jgi:hypothetical protein
LPRWRYRKRFTGWAVINACGCAVFVLQVVGRGSFATVWLARLAETDGVVAVKVYAAAKARDPSVRKMIDVEIR